jgi:hypothetical protein
VLSGICVFHRLTLYYTPYPCGSEPARESGSAYPFFQDRMSTLMLIFAVCPVCTTTSGRSRSIFPATRDYGWLDYPSCFDRESGITKVGSDHPRRLCSRATSYVWLQEKRPESLMSSACSRLTSSEHRHRSFTRPTNSFDRRIGHQTAASSTGTLSVHKPVIVSFKNWQNHN